MLIRDGWRLPLLLLALGSPGSLVSQEVVTERPPTGTPTVVATVKWVSAMKWKRGEILLEWPAATGASDYRVTRTDNTPGSTETTLFQGPWTNFVFEGKTCTVAPVQDATRYCIFLDKGLDKKILYSYRVWTGGGPSPVITTQAW